MSDLLGLASKTEEGADWRGTIEVEMGGEMLEVTIRQLFDPEERRFRSMVDSEKIAEMQEAIPDDLAEELQELRSMSPDDRSDGEEERMVELNQELQSHLSDIEEPDGLYEALRYAAKKAVCPDDEDVRNALDDAEIVKWAEDEYGVTVNTPEDLYDASKEGPGAGNPGPLKAYVQERIIDQSTDGTSYEIGMQAMQESLDTEGN